MAKSNVLSEKELRQEYKERTCPCGCYVSEDHVCFDGPKKGLTFIEWIAEMAQKYPHLNWMKKY